MHFKTFFTGSLLAVAALAIPTAVEIPTRAVEKRATKICGQWDSVQTGNYTLYQDLWGQSSASSGSQCSTFTSLSGSTMVWSTSWSWAGGPTSVKSFANVVLTQSTGYQISTISSIPSSLRWRYTGTNITADVAYDLFTSSTATGSNEYEIMIWVAAFGGASPISSTGYPIDVPRIIGLTWQLYYGVNGSMKVYSFVATNQVPSFSGDLMLFFNYLAATKRYPMSQYLRSVGAGTQPFTGSNAVMSVSAYNVAINLKTSTTATTTLPPLPTLTTFPSSGSGVPLFGQCGGNGYTGLTTCAVGTCVNSNFWYSQCIA